MIPKLSFLLVENSLVCCWNLHKFQCDFGDNLFIFHFIYYFKVILWLCFIWCTNNILLENSSSFYIIYITRSFYSFLSIRLVLAASSRWTVWRHRTTILLWPNDRCLLHLWVRWLSRKRQPIRNSDGVWAAMPPSPPSTSSNLCACPNQEWNLLPAGWQRTM